MSIVSQSSVIKRVETNHKTEIKRIMKQGRNDENASQPIWRQHWFPWSVSVFGLGLLIALIVMAYFLIRRYLRSKLKPTNQQDSSLSHNATLMKLLRNDVAHSSFDMPYDWVDINIEPCPTITSGSVISVPNESEPDSSLLYSKKHFHSTFVQPTSYPGQAYYKGTEKGLITLSPQLLNFSSVQTRRRQKGLLESRRGSPGSLTLSLSPSVDSVTSTNSSPLVEKKRLESATLFLSAEQLIERASSLDNPELCFQEFWNIPMNYANREELSISGVGMKNRFETIIPNEASRVRLPQINNNQLSTYINANYIRGYNDVPKSFIATQGPLPTTIGDFWRMVWYTKSKAIVMMTKIMESNKKTCEWYLPKDINDSVKLGDIIITLISITEHSGYFVYELMVQNKSTSERRSCRHFWYCSWPDQKIPDNPTDAYLELENLSDDCQSHDSGPIIVHCSAGVGRTGCFIAFFIGKQQLLSEGGVDILRIVSRLRLERGGCVQYNEQYQFLYEALAAVAKRNSPLPNINKDNISISVCSRSTPTSHLTPLLSSSDFMYNYPLSAGRLDAYRKSRAHAFDFDETAEDTSVSTCNSP